MFKNRFALLTVVLLVLLVSLAISSSFTNAPSSGNLSWPLRHVIVPVTGAEDRPYIIDSATRSYIAWGKALQAAGNLDVSGACTNTTQENIFAGIPNNLDSATRSYIAWGLALQAKNDIGALCR